MKLDTKLKVALICSLDKSIIRQRSELTQPPSEQECNTCYCVTYKEYHSPLLKVGKDGKQTYRN